MADTRDKRRTNRSSGFHSGPGNTRPGGSSSVGKGPGRQTSGSTRPSSLTSPGTTPLPVRGDTPGDKSPHQPELGSQYGKDFKPKYDDGQNVDVMDGKDMRLAPPPKVSPHKVAAPTPAPGGKPTGQIGTGASGQKADGKSNKITRNNQGGKSGLRAIGGLLSRNRKKFGVGGILIALVGVVTALILGLAPFKLIHIFEMLDQFFGARENHSTSLRMGKIWSAVADKNGNLHYQRDTGHPLRDHIFNISTGKLVTDMREKGVDMSLDKVTGHLLIDGQPAQGKLSDQRSQVRGILDNTYPEDGYWRRSLRTYKTFRAFGIQRTFFENTRAATREKFKTWDDAMKHKLREWLFGENPETTLSVDASNNKQKDSETAKAIDDLNAQWGAEANAARDHALSTNDPIPQPKVELNDAELAKEGATDSAKGALNATAWLSRICDAKNTMQEVVLAAGVLRQVGLVRSWASIAVPAQQIMSGDDVSASEVDSFMKTLDNVENSDAYQVASGADPHRQFTKTAPMYSLDLTKQGKGGALFVHISNVLDSIAGKGAGGAVCKVATNFIFQIASTIATIGLEFFTPGGPVIATVASAATSSATSFATGALVQIVKPIAINMLAGMVVNGDEPGNIRFDAMFGGGDIFYNLIFRHNGAHKLSPTALQQLDETIAAQQAAQNEKLSLTDRVFNINNPGSAMARVAMIMPTSLGTLSNALMNLFSYLNPIKFEQALVSPNGVLMRFAAPASADYPALDDPLAIPQYGFTDA